jgi:CheY-like chemotaxis protein
MEAKTTYALIIDDNKQMAEALEQMLKLWDIPTRIALTPSAAMAILVEATPRMVFLDINMPGVDGFEVLGYLKREPRLAGSPVIVVTSDDQPETAQRALAGGAEAIIIKPVMIDLLEETLQKAGILV